MKFQFKWWLFLTFACLLSSKALAVEFSGNLLMPEGLVSDGTSGARVVVEAFDNNGAVLLTEFDDFEIPANQSSVPFSFTIPDLAITMRVQYFCRSFLTLNCDGITANTIYYTPDELSLLASTFAVTDPLASASLELKDPGSFSGLLRLPNGITDSDLNVSLNLMRYTNGATSSFPQQFTIAAGTDNVAYSYAAQRIGLNQDYAQLEYRIFAGSSIYVTTAYYTPSGFVVDINDPATRLNDVDIRAITDLSLLPIDFRTISGQVVLPEPAPAGGIAVRFDLSGYDGDGNRVTNSPLIVTIPEGELTADYSLSAEPNTSVTFQLKYGCNNTRINPTAPCERLIKQTYFTPDGIKFAFQEDESFFPIDQLPAMADIFIQDSLPTNGTITLDTGPAATDVVIDAVITAFSESERILASRTMETTISAGESSTGYSFLGSFGQAAFYTLGFECRSGCDSIQTKTYFRTASANALFQGLAASKIFPAQSGGPFPASRYDILIGAGNEVSGSIQLPSGTATDNIEMSVKLELYNESSGSLLASYDDRVIIAAGANSAPYSLVIPNTDTQGAYYVIRYECLLNCGQYVFRAFYSDTGPQFFRDDARIQPANLPANADLELVIGDLVSGTITLEEGVAQGDTSLSIELNPIDGMTGGADEPIFYVINSLFIMKDGDASVDYSIAIPPAVSLQATKYAVRFDCVGNCGTLKPLFFYTDAGIVFSSQGTLQADTLFNLDQIEWPTGRLIDVVIELEESSSNAVRVSASTFAFDSQGEVIAFNNITDNGVIPAGQLSLETQLLVFPKDAAYYQLSYGSSSENYLARHYYTPNGPRYAETSEVRLNNAQLPSLVNLVIESGTLVNFQPRLPVGFAPVNEDVQFAVTAIPLNAAGQFQALQTFRFFIPRGETSTVEQIAVVTGPDTARFEFRFECNFSGIFGLDNDCSSFEIISPSYTQNLDATALPDPVVLQLIESVETVINPDSFEVDNDIASAKPIRNGVTQTRNIHEVFDSDYIRINLEEDAASLVVQSTSDPRSGNMRITLFDENEDLLSSEDDELTEEELLNTRFSHLSINDLTAGTYYLKVSSFTSTVTTDSYQIRVNYPDKNEETCFVIAAKNGAVIVFCL